MDEPRSLAGSEAALRSLSAASEEVTALRSGQLAPDQARGHILRVANAVERALRRLLRDDEAADLNIRLKALAPDELPRDAVLAELRRNERLSMAVAASIHELLEIRRRLEQGGVPSNEDGGRAVRVAERLRQELTHPGAAVESRATIAAGTEPARIRNDARPTANSPTGAAVAATSALPTTDAAEPAAATGRRFPAILIGTGVLLVPLLVAAVMLLRDGGPDGMDQGIALFRTGAYAEAAQHFFRYAEANPDDATPHLYLARIHRRLDRPELAGDAIREAQRLAPEDAAVHRELGFLLLDTGQATVAVDRFRDAIRLDPESSEGWVGLVRALRESGRAAEVAPALAEAPAEVRALLASSGAI